MPYVMVPVPEEHVQEAMEAVLRITRRAELSDWTHEDLADLYHQVDEGTRSMLAIVARAVLSGKQLTHPLVADTIHITTREVTGILRDLHDAATEAGHHPILLSTEATETLPNGRTRVQRVLTMDRNYATIINTVEREELAGAPSPLAGIDE